MAGSKPPGTRSLQLGMTAEEADRYARADYAQRTRAMVEEMREEMRDGFRALDARLSAVLEALEGGGVPIRIEVEPWWRRWFRRGREA